ncbi:MAG: TIGR00730 family Rossman fold protein [Streptosporangiaceae bacterium]
MKRVCVFSGSNVGGRAEYQSSAVDLGRTLAANGVGLAYGGASVGLMGAVADAVLAEHGEAVGVIPQQLVDKELAHTELTELRIVTSMHERKALLADLADGFIALPGGFGTLEEFAEIVTWSQLGLHAKPCGLLNAEGFYDTLLQFVDHAVDERFIPASHRDLILVGDSPAELLDAMWHWEPPAGDKWIDLRAPAP